MFPFRFTTRSDDEFLGLSREAKNVSAVPKRNIVLNNMSLVQDILITQPFKVLALAALLSLLIKKPPKQDPVIGTSLFMSKEGENKVSRPPQEDELAEVKDTSKKEWNMLEAIKEIVSFLLFGFLLLVVCYGNQHPSRYQFTKSVSNTFGQNFHSVSYCYSPMNSITNTIILSYSFPRYSIPDAYQSVFNNFTDSHWKCYGHFIFRW